MLPDDVYRSKLSATVASIRRAVDCLNGSADVALHVEAAKLRLALSPHVKGACPLEVLVRADQHYDIEVGSEFYEDCEIGSFDDFPALIGAVARGDVVTRHYFSAATGSLAAVATVVSLGGGREWRREHGVFPPGRSFDPDTTLVKDRTFLPYQR